MSTGSMAVLNSNGKWAAYFGGPETVAALSLDVYWRWHVINASFSFVLQLSLLALKLVKSRNLNSQQSLAFVRAGNFLNVNGMMVALVLTSSFSFFYALINNNYLENSYDDYTTPPPSIWIIAVLLMLFQVRPYVTNHALR